MAHQDMATKHKPIGYWLKHADNVITEHLDRVLSENGFTRSRWQVLNMTLPSLKPARCQRRRLS